MRKIKLISAFLAGSAILAPAALMAQESERTTTTTTTTETQRYYDPVYNTYHNWDANEDRAYHTYYQENHRTYVEYPKADVTVQREYWKWRHDHPDKVIIKSETHEEK
jgi:hypothetical protein